MPELIEVEIYKKEAEKCLENEVKNLISFCSEITKLESFKNFEGKKLNKVFRYGKYLFLQFDNQCLVLHFGMTGKLTCNKDIDKKHLCLKIDFENNQYLCYFSIRKLGRIFEINNFRQFLKQKNLGKDALRISYKQFYNLVKNKKSTAKSFLMNQHIISGIGNIYSDEILFQSKIHPLSKINHLPNPVIKILYKNIKYVFEEVIKDRLQNKPLPVNFLIPNRNKNGICPVCKNKLKYVKILSRTSYFCENCQKMY